MTLKSKRLFFILLTAFVLLLIPLAAMQFTDEVNWTLLDFIVAGALLFGTGLMCELAIRRIHSKTYRIVICATLLSGLILVWAELAVGIFGAMHSG